MKEKKKHLSYYGSYNYTMCGIEIGWGKSKAQLASSYKEVTCERCMKSECYKKYLAGEYREKLEKKKCQK